MQNEEIALSEMSKTRHNYNLRSRRAALAGGAIAGLAGALGISLLGEKAIAATPNDNTNDAAILNNALFGPTLLQQGNSQILKLVKQS
jgi:hypothetical protein